MLVLILLLGFAVLVLATLMALGWVADTREPGREWYPAASDLRPEETSRR